MMYLVDECFFAKNFHYNAAMSDNRITEKYVKQFGEQPHGVRRWLFLYNDGTGNAKPFEADGEFAHIFPYVLAYAQEVYGEGWIEVWPTSGRPTASGPKDPPNMPNDWKRGIMREGWSHTNPPEGQG